MHFAMAERTMRKARRVVVPNRSHVDAHLNAMRVFNIRDRFGLPLVWCLTGKTMSKIADFAVMERCLQGEVEKG